jgi:hypothetical protein
MHKAKEVYVGNTIKNVEANKPINQRLSIPRCGFSIAARTIP